ncbi:MAG: AI-2E family transporter [Candidatus Woesebacteria bacterium]|jgi:predicted PurR-regulated permease PerM
MIKPVKIEVSHRTIVFTVFLLISLWVLYQIRDIIMQFFIALLIMSILNPTVTKLSKYKIPRTISVLIAYFLMIGIFGLTFAALIPTLIEQTTGFVNGLPAYVEKIGVFGVYSEQIVGQLISQVGSLPSQFAKVIVSVLSNALGVLTVLIFAFYLLISRGKIDSQWGNFFGQEKGKEITKVINLLEKRLGGWARGQLSLMFLVWSVTYIGLFLLGIPFAIPLSILAGLLELVPYIGPIIAAIPAVIIGLGISPVVGLAVAALYFLIQQLENYIFVPKVMEKSVGVHPVIILLALTIGFRLAGVVGVLISIPLVITIQVLVKKYLFSK